MKYGQLIKHSMKIFFCKIHTKNELGRLDLNHFLYFRKAFYKVYNNVYKKYNKNKLNNIPDCWSRDLINFNFLKGPETSFLPYFVYDFSRKVFFML